jgi:chromosome segregation ATPase
MTASNYNMQLSECEQRYESALKQVSHLQEVLAEVSREKALLEDRFHTLAENHEQMIRIKDEYKRAVGRFSGEEKKESVMVEQLQDELKQTKSSRDELEKKCELLERHIYELESKMDAERIAYKLKIKELNSSHLEESTTLKRSLDSEYFTRLIFKKKPLKYC